MTSSELIDKLKKACEGAASAVRITTKLAPVGGPADKVFPPTYEGGKYHIEGRNINGEIVNVVVLDSVQSQVNRIEESLAAARELGEIELPLFKVTLPGYDPVTTLTAPHRVYDAIFRDSELDGKPFQKSEVGRRLVDSRVSNATALYEFSPTVLFLGAWDSHGGAGVKSAKIPRALTSEIIGFKAVSGTRSSSRVDPLGIERGNRTIYKHPTDSWTFSKDEAVKDDKGKAVAFGKEGKAGKPSSIGHGNVTPTISEVGGTTISEAVQTTVLSFVQLRRLRFPDASGQTTVDRNVAGRAVIAALALSSVALQLENGYDLRSRCFLQPTETPKFEFIGPTSNDVEPFELTKDLAFDTFNTLREQAAQLNLPWRSDVIELTPSNKLLELVRSSEQLTETTVQEEKL
jgi:CRISPR-associated protein Csb1